jgi:hypothetical protein
MRNEIFLTRTDAGVDIVMASLRVLDNFGNDNLL